MKIAELIQEANTVASDLERGAKHIEAKGWKIGTNDPEGKRGEDGPRIMLSKKSTKVRFAHEKGEYTFAIQAGGKGWGSMWRVVANNKTMDGLLATVDENLK